MSIVDWSQKVRNACIQYKQSHLSCCGIGAFQGFTGSLEPDWDEVADEYREQYEYNLDYYVETEDDDGEELPERERMILAAIECCGPSMRRKADEEKWEDVDDFIDWRLKRHVEEWDEAPTVGDECARIAEQMNEWAYGEYQQIVFSGCVSEFVPRVEGRGTYNKGFHAGRFAEWLAEHNYGHLYPGPVSNNKNHDSMVQAWVWVPPWVAEADEDYSTYANYDNAEAEETIYD